MQATRTLIFARKPTCPQCGQIGRKNGRTTRGGTGRWMACRNCGNRWIIHALCVINIDENGKPSIDLDSSR